jgi:hypothetical protein
VAPRSTGASTASLRGGRVGGHLDAAAASGWCRRERCCKSRPTSRYPPCPRRSRSPHGNRSSRHSHHGRARARRGRAPAEIRRRCARHRRRWRRGWRLLLEPRHREPPDPHDRDPGRRLLPHLPMARYVFITGGVVSSFGQGSCFGGARRASAGAWLQASACASSTPISTSIRARCRRTSTARSSSPMTAPRPTSTSATTSASPAVRRTGWTTSPPAHLPGHHRQGAPRRLSRRHRAGHPARHRRHQGLRAHRQRGCRLRPRRDRRHGRRHRGPAVLRGDPPARQRAAARRRRLHPPDADALHPDGGRAQDQADPALGEGAALDRHPARHPAGAAATGRSPIRSAASWRCSAMCARAR